ncbi:MAG TPA: DUF2142 domain-containing protein [Thermoanaerobaculia bacterium]|nr:DUF2142 domain-containing protein [Thermoanaerobaculia bacterium]
MRRVSFDRGIVAYALTAMVTGLVFAAVTPPFRVPDEEGHFLRAAAIAYGDPQPAVMGWRPFTSLPEGFKAFVTTVYKLDVFARYSFEDLKGALSIPLRPDTRVHLPLPAWYSPVPYLPQAVAALGGRIVSLRPLILFYAGRVVNLIAAVILVAMATQAAPRRRLLFIVPALLPMTLFQFASWSPDAATIGAAFLLTALMLRAIEGSALLSPREVMLLSGAGFALGLCKPVYFLLGCMVFAIPRDRFQSGRHRAAAVTAVLFAVLAGTVLAMVAASRSYYRPRPELPIDPAQQLRCIERDPVRHVRTTLRDLRTNGASYIEQMLGRLGLMNVKIPFGIRILLGALLLLAALAAAPPLSLAQRLLFATIIVVTIGGISLSQYLVWTPVCSDTIEGMQGRYFLPIVPLILALLGVQRWRWRSPMGPFLAVAGIANLVALSVLVARYWGS